MIVFDKNGKPKLEIQVEDRMIILPGDPDFLVDRFSPDWRQVANQTNGEFCMIGRGGLSFPATWQQTTEYIYGGEYVLEMERKGKNDMDRSSPLTIGKWED